MKSKKDFTYLRDWIVTMTFLSLLWSFLGTAAVFLVIKIVFEDQSTQALVFHVIGTVVFCAVMAGRSYATGLEMSGKTRPVSMGNIIADQIICLVVYTIVYIISGCNYVAGPVTHGMITAVWGNGVDQMFIHDITLSQHLSVFIPQALLYSAVSLGAFSLAKRKKDRDPVVVKLRAELAERENPKDEFDINNFELHI